MFDKSKLALYAVTDSANLKGRALVSLVESAIKGGVTCVQLREKRTPHEKIVKTARQMKELCAKYDVPLIVNDDYCAALEAGADGVHLGREDAPIAEVRKAAGAGFVIGATAKTVKQALDAQAAGADYLGVGAVFPSPTKTDAIRITPAELRAICSAVTIPAVAIGGITAENLHELAGCGHAGIAVVSAIFGADDVQTAVETLKSALKSSLKGEYRL